jgi:cytochrome c oxidase cbb3-type subunit 3
MRTIALLGLVVAHGFALGCGNGTAKPQPQPHEGPRDAHVADADPARLDGAALYGTFCGHCHGPDAKGYKADNAPSLVNSTFLESATDDFLRSSIQRGRPGTSMAAYGKELGGPLDQSAVDRIVTFLRAQGPAAKPLGTAGSTGDAGRGAAIYARECQTCHGDAGTRGTAVHLANPQFLAAASDAFLRYAVMSGRPGTKMESFSTKLDAQQIDDVVAFVRSYAKQGQATGMLPPPTGTEPLVLNPKGKDPVWRNLRSEGGGPPRFVPADEVKKALDAKRRMIIIDARPPSDWMRAHIAGAVSIPYHDMARLSEVPDDVWAIAYCACPHHLSGVVVDELIKRGHKKALVLDEGVLEWHRRGYPMTTAPGVLPPPKEDHGE